MLILRRHDFAALITLLFFSRHAVFARLPIYATYTPMLLLPLFHATPRHAA